MVWVRVVVDWGREGVAVGWWCGLRGRVGGGKDGDWCGTVV